MRLKTFQADTIQEAMALVREQLGDDAIIVATQEEEGSRSARITAAVDRKEDRDPFDAEGDAALDTLEQITVALERHGTPRELTDRLVGTASFLGDSSPVEALAYALDEEFNFNPLPEKPGASGPIMMIGPPGTGKTVACAKLAARVALAYTPDNEEDLPVNLVAADPVRVGAVEQLKMYAERLGANLYVAAEPSALAAALTQCRKNEMVLIDTPGTNPFNLEELARIVELAEAMDLEPVMVLGAGRDAEEAAEVATAFRPVGPKRLLITGYDVARRLGSMLAAADACGLALSNVGRSPQITDGFEALSPKGLARLLLPLGAQNAIWSSATKSSGKTAGKPAKETGT